MDNEALFFSLSGLGKVEKQKKESAEAGAHSLEKEKSVPLSCYICANVYFFYAARSLIEDRTYS